MNHFQFNKESYAIYFGYLIDNISPKYLIDNQTRSDIYKKFSLLYYIRFKINIGILFPFIFLITKYKTEFAKYNTTYIHSIISTIHISYCY